jgi:hypothetical protein
VAQAADEDGLQPLQKMEVRRAFLSCAFLTGALGRSQLSRSGLAQPGLLVQKNLGHVSEVNLCSWGWTLGGDGASSLS